MSKLNDAIKDTIRKNLSGEVAGELKAYIDRMERLESDYSILQATNERLGKDLGKALEDIKKLEGFREKEGALEKLKTELEARERKLDVTIAQMETKAAQQRTGELFHLVSLIFKNRVFINEEEKHGYDVKGGSYNEHTKTKSKAVVEGEEGC